MSVQFTVTTKTRVDTFKDSVSIGDAVTYSFDLTPWQDDNSTVTSVTWTAESGSVAISGQDLTSGVASALLTFSQSGKVLVSLQINSATQKKKIWLEIHAKDLEGYADDYGLSA